MTIIMNYLLFEATEYISKWGGIGMVMKSVICYLFSRIRGKKSFTLTTAQSPEAPAKQIPAAIPFL